MRNHVEHLAEAQVSSELSQMHAEQNEIWQNLVALVLEVVLSEPHCVETQRVGGTAPVDQVLVALDDRIVAVAAGRRCDCGIARVGHRNSAKEVCVNAHLASVVRGAEIDVPKSVMFTLLRAGD